MEKLYEVWELANDNGHKLCAAVDPENQSISVNHSSQLMSRWNGCDWQNVKEVKKWAQRVVALCEAIEKLD